MGNSIKVFSPATVANVACGFDVLGFALDNTGDEMIIHQVPKKGVRITKIEGANLPMETDENVASVAVLAMLQELEPGGGFEIEIYKKIKPGSGIGSSAASSAGAVFAVNELLGKPYTPHELVKFAMEGERLAVGAAHADNVAPALLGGFTLVRSYTPLDIVKIPPPEKLFATVIHPQIEVKTADARNILRNNVSLKDAIQQWGNVGGLVAGLYTSDYGLIGRSLEDVLIEPIRSILIPAFRDVKESAKAVGALGGGISGSGPSIFTLSDSIETAEKVKKEMSNIYKNIGVDYDIHLSKINAVGVKILD